MWQLCFACLWGVCILTSMAGWGRLFLQVCRAKVKLDSFQCVALGLSLSCAIGGFMDLLGVVSPVAVLAYLAAGISVEIRRRWNIRPALSNYAWLWIDRPAALAAVALIGWAIFNYVCWASAQDYNGHDDYRGYFPFPLKMLQLGSMDNDPFSARRMVTSLGGAHFLNTFVLSVLCFQNLNLVDVSIGYILLAGLALGMCRKFGAWNWRLGLAILLVLLEPISQVKLNISSTILPVALLFSLFRYINEYPDDDTIDYSCPATVALIGAAICTLKSTLIPATVSVCLLFFVERLFRRFRRGDLIQLLTFSSLASIFVIPWMYSMWRSCGTPLFPILGRGYHATQYGNWAMSYSKTTLDDALRLLTSTITSPEYVALLFLMIFAFLFGKNRRALLVIAVAVFPNVLAVAVFMGFDGRRYAFTTFFSLFAFVVVSALASIEVSKAKLSMRHGSAALLIGLLLYQTWNNSFMIRIGYRRNVEHLTWAVDGESWEPEKDVALYTAIQERIPRNAVVLESIDKPFLLNFTRNRVLINDHPGECSPPPGMPYKSSPEKLIEYLKSQSIEYVMFSYDTVAEHDSIKQSNALSPWQGSVDLHLSDFNDTLLKWAEKHPPVYDDGKRMVIQISLRD